MFHSNLIFLLVPVLLPLAGAAGVLARETQMRRRLAAGVLLLEPIFCYLATDLRGSLTLFERGGTVLVLRGDAPGSLFSVFFSIVFCLAGFFHYESPESSGDRRFLSCFLLALAAVQLLCCAGTGFVFALAFLGAMAAGAGMMPARKKRSSFYMDAGLLGLLAVCLLAALGVLAGRAGTLVFTSGGLAGLRGAVPGAVPAGAALVLALCFCAAPAVMLVIAARRKSAVPAGLAVLAGALAPAGLLGWLRTGTELFGAAALRGSQIIPALVWGALAAAVLCAGAACRENRLPRRLALAFGAEWGCVVSALSGLGFEGISTGLDAAMGCGLAAAGLFLAAGAFMEKRSKRTLAELDGIGREMPVTLFCYALCGLSLAGLPPTLGFAVRWGLLAALPAAQAVVPVLVSALSAWYLLEPVAQGYFPGSGYEPDVKVRAGAAMIVPPVIFAGLALLGGLFAGPLGGLARGAAASLIL